MSAPKNQPPAATGNPAAPKDTAPRTVDSATLFKGEPVLNILHAGRIYRLQQTRQGKLILTK